MPRFMSKSEARAQREKSIAYLREILAPGATVYTYVTHVARSGMSRRMRVLAVVDGKIESITWHVAHACDYQLKDGAQWEIVVGGCGMDMGFAVVYALGHALFPKGGPIRKSTRRGVAKGERREANGGYLLRHEWT